MRERKNSYNGIYPYFVTSQRFANVNYIGSALGTNASVNDGVRLAI